MANEKRYLVYCHINKINGKKYIGITCQTTAERWGKNGKKYKNGIFRKAIDKYGWDAFEHIILFENLSPEEAKEKEKELIKKYNTMGHGGYNFTEGGDGVGKLRFSKESRIKMSESAKRRTDNRAKSEAYKKERSIACKKEKKSVPTKPYVKVIDDNGNVYENILEASEALGINYYTLWNQVKGRRKNKSGLRVYEREKLETA